jgi:hypothetical protein
MGQRNYNNRRIHMKIGETIPVTMEGYEVAQGIIEDMEDGVATILIPATRVQMGIATSLTDLTPNENKSQALLTDNDLEGDPNASVQNMQSDSKPSTNSDGPEAQAAAPQPAGGMSEAYRDDGTRIPLSQRMDLDSEV